MAAAATTYTPIRFGQRARNSAESTEEARISPQERRPDRPTPRRGQRVGEDLACAGCGHNLRGAAVAGNCPECGRPVGQTLHGTAVDPGERDAAADAMRSLAKSYLLSAGAPLALVACIGPVLLVLAGIGLAQRIIGLVGARRALVRGTGDAQGKAMGRALTASIAEAACWLPAILAALGACGALPKDLVGPAERLVVNLWFGSTVLSLVASWAFIDATIANHALDVERRRLPAIVALASVLPLAAAAAAHAVPNVPVIGGVATVVGTILWASACALLSHQGSGAGDELAGGPRRRVLRTPEDPEDGAGGIVRPVARRPPDDDSPIPLD